MYEEKKKGVQKRQIQIRGPKYRSRGPKRQIQTRVPKKANIDQEVQKMQIQIRVSKTPDPHTDILSFCVKEVKCAQLCNQHKKLDLLTLEYNSLMYE